jgi:hypothetical protein
MSIIKAYWQPKEISKFPLGTMKDLLAV